MSQKNEFPARLEMCRGSIIQWLKPYPSKVLASDFSISESTAKGWKRDGRPNFGAFAQMVDRWGAAFLEFVFKPVLDESDPAVEKRIRRVQSDLALIEKELAHANTENLAKNSRKGAGALGRAVKGSITTALVAVGVVGWLSVIAPQDDEMDRVRTARARVVRNRMEIGHV